MVGWGRLLRLVDEGHRFFGEVAAVGDGPVVVLLEEDGADEADHGGVVGKDAHDVGATLDLLVDPLERFVEAILRQCARGKLA